MACRLEQDRVDVLALLEHRLVTDVLDDVHDQVPHVRLVLEDQDSGHNLIIGASRPKRRGV